MIMWQNDYIRSGKGQITYRLIPSIRERLNWIVFNPIDGIVPSSAYMTLIEKNYTT